MVVAFWLQTLGALWAAGIRSVVAGFPFSHHRPGNRRGGRLGTAFGELGLCMGTLTWRQLPQLARG